MIFNIFAQLDNASDAETLLPLLLSPEEMTAINSRVLVYKALMDGQLSQREIAKIHNVSIATITRGSNNLKAMSAAQREFLQQVLQHDSQEQLTEK